MAQVSAAAALAAAPLLLCSTVLQRITVTPGNVQSGSLDTYGPLANDSYVLTPGVIDGIYDS